MAKIEEYDLVKIIKLNKNVPEAELGDTGTVLIVHKKPRLAYEVEYVLKDGSTKWLGTFESDQVKLIKSINRTH